MTHPRHGYLLPAALVLGTLIEVGFHAADDARVRLQARAAVDADVTVQPDDARVAQIDASELGLLWCHYPLHWRSLNPSL